MQIKEIIIGNLKIRGFATLAPMAGVADAAFRSVCAEWGAAMTTSEMVSAKALCYQQHDKKTHALMRPHPLEGPFAVQIFGSEPETMAEGARIAWEYVHPQCIDINMGCPVSKVAGNGDGSALLREPEKAGKILFAVKAAVPCPVTAKIRLGWDTETINAPEVAKILEANGADALTVHGRTRDRFYSGQVDSIGIRRVVESVSIPVIANGDVTDGPSAERLYSETGAAMIAVGRGALGNPFIFRDIGEYLSGNEPTPHTMEEKMEIFLRQLERACAEKGEACASREARTHAAHYIKGIHSATRFKVEASHVDSLEGWRAFASNLCNFFRKEANLL